MASKRGKELRFNSQGGFLIVSGTLTSTKAIGFQVGLRS